MFPADPKRHFTVAHAEYPFPIIGWHSTTGICTPLMNDDRTYGKSVITSTLP
jgi:hypothetical protein